MFPVIHMLLYVPLKPLGWDPILLDVVWGSIIQATLSTALTVVIGFLGALGFIGLSKNISEKTTLLLSTFIILPSFVPPLVVVLLGTQAIGVYLTGLWGIVFFHVLMNVGIIGLILSNIIIKKSKVWNDLCFVEGVSWAKYYFRGLLPSLKSDFKIVSLFLFVLYFLSFSIPLLVGNLRFGGLEVFIYEKIFLFGNWSEATQYALLFLIILLCFSYIVDRYKVEQEIYSETKSVLEGFSSSWFIILLLIPVLIMIVGFINSMVKIEYSQFYFDWAQARGTMLTGLLSGSFVFVVLSLLGYCYMSPKVSRWLFSLIAPSWVIVGFSFFILGNNDVGASFFKVSVALTILYVPYLFRLSYFSLLSNLRSQVQVALVSGANWNKIFFIIIWPQVLPTICFLSGVSAVWACGDFALSGMLLGEDMTLALQMKSLLTNYRLEQSILLLLPLVIVSVIIYLIFQGLAYVCRRNLLS